MSFACIIKTISRPDIVHCAGWDRTGLSYLLTSQFTVKEGGYKVLGTSSVVIKLFGIIKIFILAIIQY